MASNKAHHATGFAAGVIAAAIVARSSANGPFHVWVLLSFIAAVAGGTAPDWLEVAWWSRKRRLVDHPSHRHALGYWLDRAAGVVLSLSSRIIISRSLRNRVRVCLRRV
jgi:hypothetical protein